MQRIETTTTISDEVKELVRRQIKSGWTAERIAYEMQMLGHKGMTSSNLHSITRQNGRAYTVDEAAALLAIFGGRARAVTAEIERLTAMITEKERR